MNAGTKLILRHVPASQGVGAIGPAAEHVRTRTLLIGTGPLAVRAAHAIRQNPELLLVGTADSRPQLDVPRAFNDIPFLGRLHDMGSLIVDHCIDHIQVALPLQSCFHLFSEIRETARVLGIPVTFRLELLDDGPVQIGSDASATMLRYNDHEALRWPGRSLKRVVDFMAAAIILVLISPLLLLIALAVKLTSSGPVFFKQPRVGIRRREFKMWKFRTMVKNAEQLRKEVAALNNAKGISFKIKRDPRLTPIGSFLRRTSLDELPQFINVLLGEMSLVGPRPIPLWVADQLQDATYYRRFYVLPGLTGWWQVEGREQDFEVMARQDLYYVDNWTLGLDLKILMRTLPAVAKGHGAH